MLEKILAITYSCCVLHASYLVIRTLKPPNPDPNHSTKRDRMANPTVRIL